MEILCDPILSLKVDPNLESVAGVGNIKFAGIQLGWKPSVCRIVTTADVCNQQRDLNVYFSGRQA